MPLSTWMLDGGGIIAVRNRARNNSECECLLPLANASQQAPVFMIDSCHLLERSFFQFVTCVVPATSVLAFAFVGVPAESNKVNGYHALEGPRCKGTHPINRLLTLNKVPLFYRIFCYTCPASHYLVQFFIIRFFNRSYSSLALSVKCYQLCLS